MALRLLSFALPQALVLAALLYPAAGFSADRVETKRVTLKVERLAEGLEHPWAVDVLPSSGYIVTERPGRIRIVKDGEVSRPLSGVPKVSANGQGGLLDIALAPHFAESRRLFLTAATRRGSGSGTEVFSARLSEDERRLEDVRSIFAMRRFTPGSIQYGARIAFAPDGMLFVSIGDRGDRDRSQDFRDDAGAIVRIGQDGSIPMDNPFSDGKAALPEIWSKGHRNPQGIAFDPQDGRLYTAEHGARGGDEINLIEPRKNYGWPIITYGRDYSGASIGEGTAKPGLEQPIYYWDPSIAPGALAVYRGAMFPEWNGNLLVAALKFKTLARLERRADGTIGGEERIFDGEYGRLRDVVVAPDGALLLVTDADNGLLLRVSR